MPCLLLVPHHRFAKRTCSWLHHNPNVIPCPCQVTSPFTTDHHVYPGPPQTSPGMLAHCSGPSHDGVYPDCAAHNAFLSPTGGDRGHTAASDYVDSYSVKLLDTLEVTKMERWINWISRQPKSPSVPCKPQHPSWSQANKTDTLFNLDHTITFPKAPHQHMVMHHERPRRGGGYPGNLQ